MSGLFKEGYNFVFHHSLLISLNNSINNSLNIFTHKFIMLYCTCTFLGLFWLRKGEGMSRGVRGCLEGRGDA
ncbi:unnamed protein product [Meloidogyne enterolobii]|uniref:Uncharacterized protein n=1 Tax=Meloidogyne enterolobii TaxID=390850 RepID=A0ACB0Z049_MELEN